MPVARMRLLISERNGRQLSFHSCSRPGAKGWTLVASMVDMPTPPRPRASW